MKRGKSEPPRNPRAAAAKFKTIGPESIVGLHPAVPADIAGNLIYQLNDLSLVARDAFELLCYSHPVGVVRTPEGQYRVLTGVRTWQAYEAFRQRALTAPKVLPMTIHHSRGDFENESTRLRDIAVADLIVAGQLLSLHPATAQQQLDALYRMLSPDRIPELLRARPVAPAPAPAGEPVKRGRGRPRKNRN